jgi:hypothetical protein
MLESKKVLAFFGGSESEYRRVVAAGERVGPFTVAKVSREQVELTRDDERFVVAVGGSVKRTGDGPWSVSGDGYGGETSSSPPSTPSTASSAGETGGTTPAAAGGGGNNDVLRRMMERRRQEEESR